MPRTVTSCSGLSGSRSTFRRRFDMWMSHARWSPTYVLSHRCCMTSRRVKTRSGSPARSARSLNSDGVRRTGLPSTFTVWRTGSISRRPIRITALPVARRSSSRRRSTARTRESSSAMENGFVT